jgi:hypothetical protein
MVGALSLVSIIIVPGKSYVRYLSSCHLRRTTPPPSVASTSLALEADKCIYEQLPSLMTLYQNDDHRSWLLFTLGRNEAEVGHMVKVKPL